MNRHVITATMLSLTLLALSRVSRAQGSFQNAGYDSTSNAIVTSDNNPGFTPPSSYDLTTNFPKGEALVASTGKQNFATGGTGTQISGTVVENVYKSAGGYDFFFQYTNTSSTLIRTFADSGFTGIASPGNTGFTHPVQVGFTTSNIGDAASLFVAGPAAPDEAYRSKDGNMVVFGDSVNAGQTSATLIIRTNAATFGVSTLLFNGPILQGANQGPTATASGFAPIGTAISPEPGTSALLLPGILAITGLVARRRK